MPASVALDGLSAKLRLDSFLRARRVARRSRSPAPPRPPATPRSRARARTEVSRFTLPIPPESAREVLPANGSYTGARADRMDTSCLRHRSRRRSSRNAPRRRRRHSDRRRRTTCRPERYRGLRAAPRTCGIRLLYADVRARQHDALKTGELRFDLLQRIPSVAQHGNGNAALPQRFDRALHPRQRNDERGCHLDRERTEPLDVFVARPRPRVP